LHGNVEYVGDLKPKSDLAPDNDFRLDNDDRIFDRTGRTISGIRNGDIP